MDLSGPVRFERVKGRRLDCNPFNPIPKNARI